MLDVSQTKKYSIENEAASENFTSLSSENDPNQSSSSTCSFSDIIKIPRLNVPQKKVEKFTISKKIIRKYRKWIKK